MTVKDINEIIKIVCPNDEDYEKPIISPKYLRQELEQLALEQESRMLESKEAIAKKDLECKCGAVGYVIKTGQTIESEEV